MTSSISNNNREQTLHKTPFYANKQFIAAQRIVGLSLISFGFLALCFAPLTKGITVAPAVLLIGAGSVTIGASLIQQVIGHAPDCQRGRVKRVIAGILFMVGGPIGWGVGGLLWYLSNRNNRKIEKL